MTNLAQQAGACVRFLRFNKQDFLDKLYFYGADKSLNLEQNDFMKRWTHMAFARFEALNLLQECKSILYLDFDCLVLKDISELFAHKASLLADRTLHTFKYYNIFDFGDLLTFRTAILVFNDTLKDSPKLYEKFYKIIIQNLKDYGQINDQVAFSILVYQNKLDIKILDKNKYMGLVFYRASRNSSIIHAHGYNNRFWNNALCKQMWSKWWQYYEKWLELGGSKYQGNIIAQTTFSKERFRFHLSFKLGYAIIKNFQKGFFACLKTPFELLYIIYNHKKEQKIYQEEILKNPNLKLPKLEDYEDFQEGVKTRESKSYRLGQMLIKAYKNLGFQSKKVKSNH